MHFELATGAAVAIYGPLGQMLPGISPIKYRLTEHQAPLARDLLPPQNWPQDIGQMFEVIVQNNLHYLITPFVLGNAPIAQIILGPLQYFKPKTQDARADEPVSAAPIAGVPVLASWKAQAAAEIARTLVSKLCTSVADDSAQPSVPEPSPAVDEQETTTLQAVGSTNHGQQALAPMRLGPLAHDATLPEGITAARLQRVTESTKMIETPSENQEMETAPLWPAPPRTLSASAYETENLYRPVTVLRHVIETMPQAVLMSAAPDGHIVLANRAGRKLWPQWLSSPGGENETSAPLHYLVTAEEYPPEWLGLRIALRQAESFRGE